MQVQTLNFYTGAPISVNWVRVVELGDKVIHWWLWGTCGGGGIPLTRPQSPTAFSSAVSKSRRSFLPVTGHLEEHFLLPDARWILGLLSCFSWHGE